MKQRNAVAIAVFIIALLALPACEGTTGPGITPEQVVQIEEQLKRGRDALGALPADDPGRLAAEKKIAELEELLAAYKTARQEQANQGAVDPEASIAAGVQTAAPFLPPPWNAVALLVGGLIPGVAGWVREAIRRQQVERAGHDLARAIKSAAIANGGVLDFTDLTVREALKSAMPDEAREIVKKARASVPQPFLLEIREPAAAA